MLTSACACSAQHPPRLAAALDTVKSPGIYRIVLPPEIVSRCLPDLSDLRIIDGEGKEAPYVLRIGGNDPLNAGPLPIPDPKIRHWDSSNRHSYFVLTYEDSYRIDRLSLVINRPPLYRRTAVVFDVPEARDRLRLATFNIDPADSVFMLPPVRTGRLLIDVANGDDEPLGLARVASFQSGICLLAYLQPQRRYRLVPNMSNAGDKPPQYDLRYFTDTVRSPVTIGMGPLTAVSGAGLPAPFRTAQKTSGGRNTLLLWAIVVVILALLLYVSVRMVRALDKRKQDDRL